MLETVATVSQWANETFGPCTPEAAMDRAVKEINELQELIKEDRDDQPRHVIRPLLVNEAADVCITLYRYIALVDPLAIERKMSINRKRKWNVCGDGTGQHVTDESGAYESAPQRTL